ncbi:hypothetical protein vseg_020326 [Gypsophila vaccaria]
MEKHRCKLCRKNFTNGRALGGHMRSHLATLPNQTQNSRPRDRAHESSDSYGESEEADSTQYPTRPRSKRSCRVGRESPAESAQLSSVSDDVASQDEEVALCLMMLSRDAWAVEKSVESKTTKTVRVAKFKCGSCNKVFRTSRALEGHKGSNKQCCRHEENSSWAGRKIFECPFCYKVFGSGQALGGHKRSHLVLLGSSSTNNNNNNNNNNNIMTNNTSSSSACFVLDLNLPPPLETDEDLI